MSSDQADRAEEAVWQWRWAPIVWTAALLAVVYIAPVMEIVHGEARPAWLAVTALAGFAISYYATLVYAYGVPNAAWRRHVAFAIVVAITIAASVAFGGRWAVLFIFVAAAAVTVVPMRWAVPMLGAVLATAALVMHTQSAASILSSLFPILLAGLVTLVIRRMRRLILELQETREELARLAVADERERFSRDLHDLLGHTLSLIVVKAEVVRRLAPSDAEAAAREAGEIQEIGRRALAEVREAVTGYRDRGLAAELDGARAALSAAGITATVRETGTPLPAEADILAGWAVREGVTNVIRHSGASRCEIDVQRRDGHVMVEIRDNGVGSEAVAATPPSSNGLRGLSERMFAAGGEVTAGPRPGGGFRLAVSVPVARVEQEAG